jgi:hypothetical protein
MNKLLTVALAAVAANAITLRDDDDATGNASGLPPPPPANDSYAEGLEELATGNDSKENFDKATGENPSRHGLSQGTLKSYPNLQYVAVRKTQVQA